MKFEKERIIEDYYRAESCREECNEGRLDEAEYGEDR
jgi:hypothetical protein